MGKITLTNIAEELVARSGVSKEVADNLVHAIVETIEKGLREDSLVKIKGLGTFKLMEVSDRGSVDVNTGERITIKGHRKVSFAPDSAMKEFVNRPFAHFEPTELNDGYLENEVGVQLAEDEEVFADEPAATLPDESSASSGNSEKIVGEDDKSAICETVEVEDETVVASVEIDEPVGAEEVVEIAETENKEEAIVEESEETVDATGNCEDVVVDEPAVEEEKSSPVAVEKNEVTEAPVEPEAPVLNEAKPQKRSLGRGGCGWLIVILLVALAYGLYYLFAADQDPLSDYDDKIEEYNDMMVNPNLEEELGKEWGDEPQIEPVSKVALDTVKPQEEKVALPEVSTVQPKQQEAVVSQSPANAPFCAVTPVESLESKTIKDITPADTTDYVIDGTLVTHELKSGETIIQLARKYYGDKRLWPYIVKYNWMKDYNNVAIGQMINIPVLKNKE